MHKCFIICVSDRCFNGQCTDKSTPAIRDFLSGKNFEVDENSAIVPDEIDDIKKELFSACDKDYSLVLTTGGTGFSPRDVTADATEAVIERKCDGISEYMRMSTASSNKKSILSRMVSGIRGQTLIINLPGSPKACIECLSAVIDVIPHALDIIRGCNIGH